MKKRIALLVAMIMVLGMTACGSSSDSTTTTAAADTAGETASDETAAGEEAAVTGGSGAVISIGIGHGGAESTAQQVGCQALKDYVEEASGGNITVTIYPNNSMGSDDELCQMVQDGTLEMCLANSIIVNYVGDAVIYDLFYNFDNINDVKAKYLDDENFLAVMREKYTEAGFWLAGYSVHGFRVTTANKAITSPDDLAGLTFRVMQNDFHIEAWQDMGATPTPFSFSELYTALQQGTVDAQENPIELIYSQKFYEQQSYISLTNHLQQTQQWLVGQDFYDSLADEDKAIIDAGLEAACEAATDYALANEEAWTAEIEEYGCTIVELTEDQMAAFKEAVAPEWDMVQAQVASEVWEAYTN